MSVVVAGLDASFIDRFAVPTVLYDADGRFLHMNPAMEQASRRRSADRRGGHFTEVVAREAQPVAVAAFARAAGGEPGEFDSLLVDGTGAVRGARLIYIPLREDAAIVAILMLAYAAEVPDSPAPLRFQPSLTSRQREILELIAAGRSTKQIAAELALSVATVRNHTRRLLAALGAHTRLQAVALARRFGLLSPAPLRPPPPKS